MQCAGQHQTSEKVCRRKRNGVHCSLSGLLRAGPSRRKKGRETIMRMAECKLQKQPGAHRAQRGGVREGAQQVSAGRNDGEPLGPTPAFYRDKTET